MRQFLSRQFQVRQFQIRQFALKKSAGAVGGAGAFLHRFRPRSSARGGVTDDLTLEELALIAAIASEL